MRYTQHDGRVAYTQHDGGWRIPSMVGRWIPTMVAKGDTHHGSKEGYPPWYRGVHTHHGTEEYIPTMVYTGIYLPVYTTLYTPGYTTMPHTTGYTAAPLPACGVTRPWAQEWRMSWVRASLRA